MVAVPLLGSAAWLRPTVVTQAMVFVAFGLVAARASPLPSWTGGSPCMWPSA
jgi:hypothetical protein